jgi:UDP-N-acetyl-D-mannosaminuronate dehydrogenase
LPFYKKYKSKFRINLCVGVECKEKEQRTIDFLDQLLVKIKNLYFVDPFLEKMPQKVEEDLNQLVKINKISTVIIATEPTAHKAYAIWALKNNLHVLMDKPITTRKNAVYDLKEAEGIYQDYIEINAAAQK